VLKYHGWILNLQAWATTAIGHDVGNFAIKTVAKVALCPAIQQQCTGSNKQYHNELDCIARLQLKPFGSFDEAWVTTSPAGQFIRFLHMSDQKSIAPMLDLMAEAKRVGTSVSISITARITLIMVFYLGPRKVMSLLAEDRFCLVEHTSNAGKGI
jgi:hypothetical protein